MQLKIKYGVVEKNEDEIVVSLSKTVNDSDYKRSFNLKNINNWHYNKHTDYLSLNRWWTFVIVFSMISLPLMAHTFLKNDTQRKRTNLFGL